MNSAHAYLGLFVVLSLLITSAMAEPATNGGDKHLIRHKFRDGRELRYSLSVAGRGRWDPEFRGSSGWQMSTDFRFTLSTKLIRESGACTFELVGEKLESELEGEEGKLKVEADRDGWEITGEKGELEPERGNPLTREMTLTMTPRGRVRYGTRLLRLAPFFIVHVDRHFWGPLTTAPRNPVGPGDSWEKDFKLDLPDSRGRPLRVTLKTRVTGWKNYRGRRCLAGRATAELNLKDTRVTLRNGDRLNVKNGRYQAEGTVLWDVGNGILCYASARNRLQIQAVDPTRRFSGQARCTLKLLDAR